MSYVVQAVKRAELDGVKFCTVEYQADKVFDNCCVMAEFIEAETQEVTMAYGRILNLFLHCLHPDAEPEVIAECDWHDEVGNNPISGNVQICPNPNFDACRMVFLKNCVAANCVYWPSSMEDDNDLYDVITDTMF